MDKIHGTNGICSGSPFFVSMLCFFLMFTSPKNMWKKFEPGSSAFVLLVKMNQVVGDLHRSQITRSSN